MTPQTSKPKPNPKSKYVQVKIARTQAEALVAAGNRFLTDDPAAQGPLPEKNLALAVDRLADAIAGGKR